MNFIRIIQWKKKTIRIIKSVLFGTLIVVCICSCGNDTADYLEKEDAFVRNSQEMDTSDEGLSDEAEEMVSSEETTTVTVYICGAVQAPGVYVLPENSRICDVLSLAGGFTTEAATEYWNQARFLTDGEMIYVPTKEEAKDRQPGWNQSSGDADTEDGKVNINTATKDELMTIPGIGEAKAKAIISYREKEGAFSSIQDIMEIEGIKEGVFEKIKDYIKIN